MKKVFKTRKGLILLGQILAVLSVVSVLLLSQIGAFAGPDKTKPVSSTEPHEVSPTMLTATKPPETTAPAEEVAPPVDDGSYGGNAGFSGNTPAYLACQAQHKATMEEAQSVSNQSNQLWNQVNALRNSTANLTDPAEIANLNSQADALQLEADRLGNLSSQLWQQLMQGHRGFSCGPDGPVYFD